MAARCYVGSVPDLRNNVQGVEMSGPITKHHWDALAADIYARNGYRSYGIDPMSILAMLNTIVPQVLQWVADCKRLRDDEVQPAVAAMHARNPAQTKRRTAAQCAKLRRKQGEQFCKEFNVPRANRRKIIAADFTLTGEQAEQMAEDMIAECCNRSAEDVARYAAASRGA